MALPVVWIRQLVLICFIQISSAIVAMRDSVGVRV